VIVSLTRCAISEPIAEAIANGARGGGLDRRRPRRALIPTPLAQSRISRRNIGVVGYLDETDFCLMIADVVAQPFELPLFFPARRLAAEVLVCRFELLLEEKKRVA